MATTGSTPSLSATRPVAVSGADEVPRTGLLRRVRQSLAVVTGFGWVTAILAFAAWQVGYWLGWNEFMIIATVGVLCLVISIGFLFGSNALQAEVELDPQRVVVGQRAAGQIVVTNPSSRRSMPSRVELVVGDGAAEFDIPSLGAGEDHEELFVLPTERRAVIPVGPAVSVKGDPLGLLRRAVPWTEPIPLYVHPRTVPLGHLGAGFMRDLEGQPTADLSPADIAFHALREYAPGDDRRFVHWMTTARVGKLMVRQFTDTRRAHLAVVVDGAKGSYADSGADYCEEFETAVSIAGSLGVRAISDEQDVTMMAAGRQLQAMGPAAMLDGLAGVGFASRRSHLVDQVDRLNRQVSGISLAVLITGSNRSIADIRAAMFRFSIDVRTIAVRVDSRGETGFRRAGSTMVLTVASLDELAQLLWAVTQ